MTPIYPLTVISYGFQWRKVKKKGYPEEVEAEAEAEAEGEEALAFFAMWDVGASQVSTLQL